MKFIKFMCHIRNCEKQVKDLLFIFMILYNLRCSWFFFTMPTQNGLRWCQYTFDWPILDFWRIGIGKEYWGPRGKHPHISHLLPYAGIPIGNTTRFFPVVPLLETNSTFSVVSTRLLVRQFSQVVSLGGFSVFCSRSVPFPDSFTFHTSVLFLIPHQIFFIILVL